MVTDRPVCIWGECYPASEEAQRRQQAEKEEKEEKTKMCRVPNCSCKQSKADKIFSNIFFEKIIFDFCLSFEASFLKQCSHSSSQWITCPICSCGGPEWMCPKDSTPQSASRSASSRSCSNSVPSLTAHSPKSSSNNSTPRFIFSR